MAGAAGHEHFFEGTEKLLEVWFASGNGDDSLDLRVIERYENLFIYMFVVNFIAFIYFDRPAKRPPTTEVLKCIPKYIYI